MTACGNVETTRSRESGASLVEVVVVLAVIGIMSGVAVLSLGGFDRGDDAEAEALQMAARINLAADLVLIEGGTFNLAWDTDGYSFARAPLASMKPDTDEDGLEAFGGRHDMNGRLDLAGPTTEGSLDIRQSFGVPPVVFTISGQAGASRVEFNGLAASVSQEGPP